MDVAFECNKEVRNKWRKILNQIRIDDIQKWEHLEPEFHRQTEFVRWEISERKLQFEFGSDGSHKSQNIRETKLEKSGNVRSQSGTSGLGIKRRYPVSRV